MSQAIARTLDLTSSEEECGDTALQLVRRAYGELAPGDVLEVKAVVAEHAFVVRAWARKTGAPLLDDRSEGRETHLLLQRPADG
jgi:TusA-related sulfurtransferase